MKENEQDFATGAFFSRQPVDRNMMQEARNCREQASSFAGKPEEGLLRELARAFEELAVSR